MNTEYVLGIDFGTTNSVCAILSGGDPEIIENAEGDRLTPSVVYYTKENEQFKPLVGKPAENKAQENPERVLRSIKRDMGESETIKIDEESYHVEEVGAEIIRKLKRDAAEKLNVDQEQLTRAVVTTPAYWESDRNQAVIQAAELAGFESVRTIKEPAAAAIAYGRFEPGLDKTVGVYDLGGGTFDFAVVDVDVSNTSGEYNVLAQSGDPQLGGDDWDQKIVDWLVSQFMMKHDVNPLKKHHSDDTEHDNEIRKERIREAARQAKEDLSNRSTTTVDIRIPFFMTVDGEQVNVEESLTQSRFESMTEELLERSIDPVYTALNDADVKMEQVDEVILVGGSTRMPQVKELVKSVFNTNPKNRVNPDEAVACGAAIKANRDDILLLEVTPLSLGIGINGGEFKRMIDRNERLPARTTEVFTTANEGATAVRIPIYQGERNIASENRHLKTLIIDGMAPGSKSSAHIEVTFEVQQNGLINVQAVENTRNKSVEVEIEGENRLPDEYINDRVQEAKELEELDRKRQKVIQAQNNAKKAIREGERLLSEFPQVFEGDESEHVKKHVSNVRQIRRNDTATLGELRDATEALDEWVLEIGDRVRTTGARSRSGPQKGPDVNAAEVESADVESGVRTSSPGTTISNTDGQSVSGGSKNSNDSSSENDTVEDWNDTAEMDFSESSDDESVSKFDPSEGISVSSENDDNQDSTDSNLNGTEESASESSLSNDETEDTIGPDFIDEYDVDNSNNEGTETSSNGSDEEIHVPEDAESDLSEEYDDRRTKSAGNDEVLDEMESPDEEMPSELSEQWYGNEDGNGANKGENKSKKKWGTDSESNGTQMEESSVEEIGVETDSDEENESSVKEFSVDDSVEEFDGAKMGESVEQISNDERGDKTVNNFETVDDTTDSAEEKDTRFSSSEINGQGENDGETTDDNMDGPEEKEEKIKDGKQSTLSDEDGKIGFN